MIRKIVSVVGILLLLTSLVLYASVFRVSRNFHVVDPGKLYRSAQLLPSEIESIEQKYHIRTIINLRGGQANAWWYQQEKKTSQELGIKLINIGLSAQTVPDKSELLKYLSALQTAPRPILIHCRSGADRTSEGAAIYLMVIKHEPRSIALKQLSIKYLHLQWFTPAELFFMKRFKGLRWAKTTYNPCSPVYKSYYDQQDFCPHLTPRIPPDSH